MISTQAVLDTSGKHIGTKVYWKNAKTPNENMPKHRIAIDYQHRCSYLECDAVVRLRNGSYGHIGVKLGGSAIDIAAQNLFKLEQKIDVQKMNSPSFLMVLTATPYGY